MKKLFKITSFSFVILIVSLFACSIMIYAAEIDEFYYGDHKLTGTLFEADKDAPITVKIGNKEYKGRLNNWDYSISIPNYYKIGTSITVTYMDSDGNEQIEESSVLKNEKTTVYVYYVFAKHNKVRGYVEYAHKGDVLSIIIGNKVYSAKVKNDSKKYKFTFKIKKAKAGTKMTINLNNMYKQNLENWKWKVFTSDVVRIGMTKKQVKLLAYWSEPTKKNVSAYSEQWCYDDDGDGWTDTYLYFWHGKVSNWQSKE